VWLPVVFSALWLATAAAGLGFLWKYENVPGVRMAVPARWPAGSAIARTPGMATVVMFAHPKCPCTRASVEELARAVAQCDGRLRVHVMFYSPDGAPATWTQTDLWSSAAAIPGVEAQSDRNGAEAARFGATTSGFVVVYDAAGRLGFSGGITAERGHAGDNDGEEAVIALANGKAPGRLTMPALGCSIFNRADSSAIKGAVCRR
jgi:hypothetical protein